MNELDKICFEAYESALLYKRRLKDGMIKG